MADEAQLRSLMTAAEQALQQGRRDEGMTLVARARSAAPNNPDVLAAAGILTLRSGDAAQAQALIQQAIELDPNNPRHRVNLAMALRAVRDDDRELQTLQEALRLDPYFFTANLQRGSLLELQGKHRQAARAYHAALSSVRPGMALPAALRPALEHAQEVVQAHFRELEERLNLRMAPVRQRHAAEPQDRVDDCLAEFLGRKRIYYSQPTVTHFPRLAAISFFDRRIFPWIAAVEAATDDIRQELLQVLEACRDDFMPYVSHAPGTPLNQWKDLNNSRGWTALFLHQDGQPRPDILERCPHTVAALAHAPQPDISARAPTAFFSRLAPRTRIPPHTGATNTRLIVHVPLIIPPGCGFRVGAEVREWQPGTALIFDDTIEHEAWNDSDQERVILIFDIWNPLLSAAERDLMTVAAAGIAEFFDAS
ncbi:MAG TPA: aspartyl/asparaginyl beta-hydroxylase domain-containing protein [Steroidobacteraceae bacterium]|nr:aspartyl/asparaginyl beta-hydroxylase domain-containing protein [Steroidobacteraceae bacterium]